MTVQSAQQKHVAKPRLNTSGMKYLTPNILADEKILAEERKREKGRKKRNFREK